MAHQGHMHDHSGSHIHNHLHDHNHVFFGIHPDADAVSATIGGLLIGLSSTLYLVFTGRVAGLSSIFEGLVTFDFETFHFKSAFVAGLIHGVLILSRVTGVDYTYKSDPYLNSLSVGAIFVAGLLVGFGTRLGNGCTSGHGVVGLSRRSPRSLVSVLTFLVSAIAIATVYSAVTGRHVGRQFPEKDFYKSESAVQAGDIIEDYAGLFGLLLLPISFISSPKDWRDSVLSYVSAIIFSMGLAISGMSKPSKVVGFLAIGPNWDYSLLFVLGSSVGFNLVTFHFIHEYLERPILAEFWPTDHPEENFQFPGPTNNLDLKLILGGLFFGLGWGLSGICPGPAVLLFVSGSVPAVTVFIPAMIFGMILAVYVKKNIGNDYIIKPIVHQYSEKKKAEKNKAKN